MQYITRLSVFLLSHFMSSKIVRTFPFRFVDFRKQIEFKTMTRRIHFNKYERFNWLAKKADITRTLITITFPCENPSPELVTLGPVIMFYKRDIGMFDNMLSFTI